ncbi:flagellar export apparatus, flagellar assembly protein FliH [Campylobacter iguaniorum]|uniref:Flagellar assembly protein FliH n=1 Tax=Campylobacter iguaniorum TaxID=1244531 RepID=A0A076F7A7_9BACT|nr:flagellar assembly protein FliH [Campylobacter iguaniorum]AII14150.1 flagellar export apparatus, flagellar assembly protein FliH [Campylobacter iguaniorum]ALV23889.1 flagellar export apparatus, flagellar assembly protein FliH [Campylobacter iguaniorum]
MKQSNVVTNNDSHIVEPYRFKVLGTFPSQEEPPKQEEQPTQEPNTPETQTNAEQPPVEPPKIAAESSFIEELLKKTDELSDNIVKLQMQIENQENEFKTRLQEEVTRARDEGQKDGEALAKTKFDEQLKEIQNKYLNSLQKLDEEKLKLENLYTKSEAELAKTAVQIAKEVINKEVKDNSSLIASNIAKSLTSELNDASNIEIKTNPKDYEFIQENFKESSNIRITKDDAISPGGVIVLSDIGNVDGDVMARFEKIKKILSE